MGLQVSAGAELTSQERPGYLNKSEQSRSRAEGVQGGWLVHLVTKKRLRNGSPRRAASTGGKEEGGSPCEDPAIPDGPGKETG